MEGAGDGDSARGRRLEVMQKMVDDGMDGTIVRMLRRGVESSSRNTTGLRVERTTGGNVGLGK